MKALSLKQPWAELILQGKKKIELRKWNTKFRGKFLIHASKNPDGEAMIKFGFKDLPCGFIVGKAELVDVKEYKNDEAKDAKKDVEFENDKDLHLASRERGNFGFILKNAERAEKIPAKGSLGFWEFGLNNF